MPEKQQKSWQHGVAGCTAGLVSVLVLHPLDVIKTRLQVQDGVLAALPAYRGTAHALRSIVAEEGWQALYSGLSPALFGAGLSWGLYFMAYNRAKQRWQGGNADAQLSPVQHLLSAAEGGAVVCLLTNPIWVVKTRLQLQRGAHRAARRPVASAAAATAAATAAAPATQYRGLLDALYRIPREEGFRGLYRGLGPSLIMVSHGAIQFMVYEELKRQLAARSGRQGGALTSAEITLVGAASKLFATLSTYPFSVIRSRLQQRQARGRAVFYSNGWTALRLILRREGARGLYKGVVPNVLRVMPSSALTLLVYEKLMQHALPRAEAWQAARWQ